MDTDETQATAGAGQPQRFCIRFVLESDATFGRGDGIVGLVDEETDHDADGFPLLRGRALKGLLNEECANIFYSLQQANAPDLAAWQDSARRLFGKPGSDAGSHGWLRFGDAGLPDAVQAVVRYELGRARAKGERRLDRNSILESLTAIRRQTAMDVTGAPVKGSLRTIRVVLRETPFEAELVYTPVAEHNEVDRERDLALLAACIKAWRRAGTGRNRGRGRLYAALHDAGGDDVTQTHFGWFSAKVYSQEKQP